MLVVAGLGCGGGDPCAGSPCPNDARPTAAEYDSCVKQHSNSRDTKCYAQSVNLELCARASTVCGSNGKTDAVASSNKTSTDCKQAFDSVLCCSFGLTSCR